jgi:hypothetical protein
LSDQGATSDAIDYKRLKLLAKVYQRRHGVINWRMRMCLNQVGNQLPRRGVARIYGRTRRRIRQRLELSHRLLELFGTRVLLKFLLDDLKMRLYRMWIE